MTGPELQSRLIRNAEARYQRTLTELLALGEAREATHRFALADATGMLGEALAVLRARGLFGPEGFPPGEIDPERLRFAGRSGSES